MVAQLFVHFAANKCRWLLLSPRDESIEPVAVCLADREAHKFHQFELKKNEERDKEKGEKINKEKTRTTY